MLDATPHGTYGGYSNHRCRCDECKAAMREYHRARYASSPEKYRVHGDAWRRKNPEAARAISRRANARQYVKNRATLIAAARAWAAANPERCREIKSAWKKRNPEKDLASVQRRRAKQRGLPTYEVSERDWRRLCQRHDNRCAYCGARSKLTMDHVVPIDRGGQHSIGNLLPACGSCNSSKGPKLLVEWRALRAAA